MIMSDPGPNTTTIATVKSNHASAETGGITFNTGATLAPVGNATTWSRASARAALAAGGITQSQFVSVMQAIASWESSQNAAAYDSIRGTGMLFFSPFGDTPSGGKSTRT
jgi:hypothetical protein